MVEKREEADEARRFLDEWEKRVSGSLRDPALGAAADRVARRRRAGAVEQVPRHRADPARVAPDRRETVRRASAGRCSPDVHFGRKRHRC